MENSRICIALDFQTKAEVEAFLDRFEDEQLYVKVGMELFYGEGIEMINAIKERGHKIFLDLKLHDIPNTVKSAMKQLAKLDVDMVNVHASGSRAMMKAAIEGLEEGKTSEHRPLCIAVTCLTSLDQEVLDNELLIHDALEDVVLSWAKNAKEAGVDGVVCSPLESKVIHDELGEEYRIHDFVNYIIINSLVEHYKNKYISSDIKKIIRNRKLKCFFSPNLIKYAKFKQDFRYNFISKCDLLGNLHNIYYDHLSTRCQETKNEKF